MKKLRINLILLLTLVIISCGENIETEVSTPGEEHSVIIDDVTYTYSLSKDPNTGDMSVITGPNSDQIKNFFNGDSPIHEWNNLSNGEVKYYSSTDLMMQSMEAERNANSSGIRSQALIEEDLGNEIDSPVLDNPDDGDPTGGGSTGGSGGSGNTGGSGGGSTTTSGFGQCPQSPTAPMVQLAEHADGQGRRVDMYHNFPSALNGQVGNFLSFPYTTGNLNPSGPVNFNDILSSIKICRGSAAWVDFYIYEHAGYGGHSKVFTLNNNNGLFEATLNNLKNFQRGDGVLGLWAKDWNDVVSSAKIIVYN
ncbi:hypothetical protein BFP97_07245 [Roseivirga sp. 4D4]|uniref:hypothetical protein n=1 Tax=Roseivirga sp. 4D4 TaxID=1889784 RepID=UPI00085301AA|nr:hypothetical protein [Roseivirga sp. 4D4]OEK01322.1 hypothetical protein BFP97_07245 [Roseivirga sp. 4D4]